MATSIQNVDIRRCNATLGALIVPAVDARDGTPLARANVARMNVIAGTTLATALANGSKTGAAQVDVAAGERRALTVRLDPVTESRALGRVIDAEPGAPVAGAALNPGGLSAISAATGSFGWDAGPQARGRIGAQQARYHAGSGSVRAGAGSARQPGENRVAADHQRPADRH